VSPMPGSVLPSLTGTRVIVTRAPHQAGGVAEHLRRLGATVKLLPLIEVVPPADPRPLRAAATAAVDGRYDWIVLTSANAVTALVGALPSGGGLSPHCQLAVIGIASERALLATGYEPSFVSGGRRGEDLVEELGAVIAPGDSVFLPRAADARRVVENGLVAFGARVNAVSAYDKRLPSDTTGRARMLLTEMPIGWMTFTSPSIVEHLLEVHDPGHMADLGTVKAASIGPTTTEALRAAGIPPTAEALQPSAEALVDALLRAHAS